MTRHLAISVIWRYPEKEKQAREYESQTMAFYSPKDLPEKFFPIRIRLQVDHRALARVVAFI